MSYRVRCDVRGSSVWRQCHSVGNNKVGAVQVVWTELCVRDQSVLSGTRRLIECLTAFQPSGDKKTADRLAMPLPHRLSTAREYRGEARTRHSAHRPRSNRRMNPTHSSRLSPILLYTRVNSPGARLFLPAATNRSCDGSPGCSLVTY